MYNWWLVLGLAAGVLCRGAAFFTGAAFFLIPSFFLFPHDWSWRRKTGSCYRRVSGNSGRSVHDNDRAVSGSFVVSGAYVERQKLWTAYGVFASLCRASDGTENLFQLR